MIASVQGIQKKKNQKMGSFRMPLLVGEIWLIW
jgi:hypothetical protein